MEHIATGGVGSKRYRVTFNGPGGHSYGAFSTMNAISLVPWFKGAIAGDGMYNRSLTPFGFQSERRNFLAYLLFMALMQAREEDRGRTTPHPRNGYFLG